MLNLNKWHRLAVDASGSTEAANLL